MKGKFAKRNLSKPYLKNSEEEFTKNSYHVAQRAGSIYTRRILKNGEIDEREKMY